MGKEQYAHINLYSFVAQFHGKGSVADSTITSLGSFTQIPETSTILSRAAPDLLVPHRTAIALPALSLYDLHLPGFTTPENQGEYD